MKVISQKNLVLLVLEELIKLYKNGCTNFDEIVEDIKIFINFSGDGTKIKGIGHTVPCQIQFVFDETLFKVEHKNEVTTPHSYQVGLLKETKENSKLLEILKGIQVAQLVSFEFPFLNNKKKQINLQFKYFANPADLSQQAKGSSNVGANGNHACTKCNCCSQNNKIENDFSATNRASYVLKSNEYFEHKYKNIKKITIEAISSPSKRTPSFECQPERKSQKMAV